MENLNLPIIKGKLPAGKHLSMNEYLKFVNLNLKYTVDKESNEKQKRLSAVNKPFSF